jgi:translocation and assembly module TamA
VRLGRVAAGVLAVGAMFLAAHSPPVREYTRLAIVAWGSQTLGVPIAIGELRYDLRTLRLEADNVFVTLATDQRSGHAFARRVAVDLAWSHLQRYTVKLSDVEIVQSIPQMQVGVELRGLQVSVARREPLGFDGQFDLRGTGLMRVGTVTERLTQLSGSVRFQDETLHIDALQVASADLAAHVGGYAYHLGTGVPGVALNGVWRGNPRELCAKGFPRAASCQSIGDAAVHGRLAVEGEWAAPVLRVDLDQGALVMGRAPVSVSASLRLSARGVAITQLDAQAIGGRIRLRGEAPFGAHWPAAEATLDWQGLDARSLGQLMGGSVSLDGRIDGAAKVTGNLSQPGSIRADAWARVTTARGARVSAAADLIATVRDAGWTVRLRSAHIGATTFRGWIAGTLGERWDQSLTLHVNGALHVRSSDLRDAFGVLPAGRVAPPPSWAPDWQGIGAADLMISGTIADPRLTGSVEAALVHATDVPPLQLRADVRLDRVALDIRALHSTWREARLDGWLRYEWTDGLIDGEFRTPALDLGPIDTGLGWAVTGRAVASGRITGSLLRPRVDADVAASDVAVSRTTSSEEASTPIAIGAVDLELTLRDQLDVRASIPAHGITADGSLRPDGEWPFTANLQLREADLTQAMGAVVRQPQGTLRMDGDVTARGQLRLIDDVEVDVQLNRLDVTVGRFAGRLEQPLHLRLDGGVLATATVDATFADLAVRLARTSVAEPIEVRVEGQLPPVLSIWEEDSPAITVDAVMNESAVVVRHAAGRWRDATAKASAHLPLWMIEPWVPDAFLRAGPRDTAGARALLELRAVPLSHAADWLLPPQARRVAGTVDMVLEAWSDAASLTALRVDGLIEHASVIAAGVHLNQQGVARLALQNGIISLTDAKWTSPGVDVTVDAESSIDVRRPPFKVEATADVDLATAAGAVADRVSGQLHVALAASRRGDEDGVSWNGGVQLDNGAWVAERQDLAITDLDATVACADRRCRVESLTGRLNSGTLVVTGDIPMPDHPSAALTGALRHVVLELPKGARHDLDADLVLVSDEALRLTGNVTVWPGTISESLIGLASLFSQFAAQDVTEERLDLMTRALAAVALDVRIVTGDELVFSSRDLEAAASAQLRLRGTIAAPQIHGQIAALDHGWIFLAGRQWRVDEGHVSLGDTTGTADVRLSATLSTRISKYAVRLALSGSANRPALVLSADPPLGQSDLAELVLTGTTSGNLGRSSAQRVASALSIDLVSTVGRAAGIDAIRIEQSHSELSATELEPISRLTVSKRMTERLDVVYSQALNEDDDVAWVLVWKPGWGGLDLRATIWTNGTEAYQINQEFEFGVPPGPVRATVASRSAAPVSRIDVIGLDAREEADVRAALSLRVGRAFTTDAWQRDRQAITKYFHDRDRLRTRVRAAHDPAANGTQVLRYEITPGGLTELDIHGYDVDRDTRRALELAWARAASDALVSETLSDVLRERLAGVGYLDAQVATTLTPLPNAGQIATMTVARGPRTTRRALVFTGNYSVASDDLERAVDARRTAPQYWLDPSVAEAPVTAVYHSRGYLAVRVAATRQIDTARATLTVAIDEGPQFTLGDVVVTGAASFGDPAARATLGLNRGAPFSDGELSAATTRLANAFARAGYLEATATARQVVRRDSRTVDITVAINEGSVSMLRHLRVADPGGTSTNLITRVMGVQPGGAVDRLALDQAQHRLYDTGIFRTVDVDVHPVATRDSHSTDVEAVVTLEERARYRVRYGLQFGPSTLESLDTQADSDDPAATFDIQRRNLYRSGITAGGGIVWSPERHRFRATASAATWAGRFVSTTLTVEQADQDRHSDEYGLDIIDRSLRAVLEQRWRVARTPRIEVAYGFDVDHRRLELQATTEAPLPLRARLAGLNATVTVDTRDNPFNPRRGLFHTSRLEVGAGWWLSDLAFARYQVQQYAYYPWGRATLASGVRFGSLDVDHERDPAAMLLFFHTGGGNSVRGYDDDALTPGYVHGLPAGGKALLVLNQELRLPLWRRVGAVVFVDAGNTFTDLSALQLRALKVGTGAGLRLDASVAVLRLDIGLPVAREPGQKRMRWYVSIGQAF